MIDEKVLIERLEKKRNASDTLFDNVVEMNAYDDGIDKAIEIVNQLAEEHNNGWIPCSERMPSKEEYLKDDGRFIVTDGNRRYMTHFDIYDTQKFGIPQLNGFCEDQCVIAWQPLPAPYKGEQK